MDDPYSYPVQGESTLSFLEKTASSIDESKSAFKASLSNITKPTADMLGYGSQSLYGSTALNTNEPAPIAKPKPKPKPRGRKPANKPEPVAKVETIPSPMAPHSMKHPDRYSLSGRDELAMRSTPTPWRIDDINASGAPAAHAIQPLAAQQPHASHGHHHSAPATSTASALGATQSHPTERNITIPHTDVNTTYNHTTNQTYQYAGYPSYLPGSKPESSMYSAQGTVHHPHTRAESLNTNTSTTSSLSSSNMPSAHSSAASSNPYSSQPTASTYNQTVSKCY